MLIPTLILAGVVFFVLTEGFFSGAETAITSADRVLIQDRAARGDARARLLAQLTKHWERFLGTTLVGTNLAVVCSTTLADLLIARWCPEAWQSLVNTALMTPFVLLFGELLPKSIGRGYANELAPALARPLHLAQILLYPLIWTAGRIAAGIANLFGPQTTHQSAFVSRDDLRILAEIAREEGLIDSAAGDMLQTLFELDERAVSSVMVHLVDVDALPLDATIEDARRLCAETGHTRFPVYKERVDNIVGVVDVRTILCRWVRPAEKNGDAPPEPAPGAQPIAPHIRTDIAFVPETKSVGALLQEMRYAAIPMVIVVDEHGGVVGIATAEDLLEEIVGDIIDERDAEEPEIVQIDEEIYECDGQLDVRKLQEVLDIEIETNGFETAAGLVLKHAGRIPRPGEAFDIAGYRVVVVAMDHRRIAKLRFHRRKPAPPPQRPRTDAPSP